MGFDLKSAVPALKRANGLNLNQLTVISNVQNVFYLASDAFIVFTCLSSPVLNGFIHIFGKERSRGKCESKCWANQGGGCV